VRPAKALEASASPATGFLPEVTVDEPDCIDHPLTRRGVLKAKSVYKELRALTFLELRGMTPSPEKESLYKAVRACVDEEKELERKLLENYVPQHSPSQFLSPRVFFVSPLFRVRSKALPRKSHLVTPLPTLAEHTALISYSGPELRQSDGRVFLALLHMLRDVQVGTNACFEPQAVCCKLFGRYDGNSRNMLRTHIQRLQRGLVISSNFSVQLCLGFHFPSLGNWTVSLDPHIVKLFSAQDVWFPMQPRLELSDGLPTWLYTFIESQTRLIPMRITKLRELCGSEACDRAFTNVLRLALQRLAAAGIIDTGWSVRRGEVRWLKKSRSTN
jgi:hypothetical protein